MTPNTVVTPPAPPAPPAGGSTAVNIPTPPYPPAPPAGGSTAVNIATPPYPPAPGAPVGGGGAFPPGVGAPLEGAAAVFDRLLPGVPASGAPSSALATPWDALPAIPVPQIPGLPVPLPKEIKMPSDGLCAGTTGLWSAPAGPASQPGAAPAATSGADRRDW